MADLEEYRIPTDVPQQVDWQSHARPADFSLFERSVAPEGRMVAPARPEPRQEQPSDRYGVFAFGTNDYRNPEDAVRAAQDIYANAKSMSMTPVFVLPNAVHEKFVPVSNALRQFAEDRGIRYETPAYDPKDPLHLTRQSAQDIAKRYPDAFVGGDSNSVRLQNWGYGRKLHDSNTYVDPRTGQVLGRVGAPSRDIANWITQYRKSLERGNFKSGGSAYPLRPHTDWEEALDYEKKGGKLTHMTPAQFLARVPALEMNDRDKRVIAHFEKQIKDGVKLDPVAIKANGKPNGRHRATAAKNLGVETLPVVIFPKRGKAANGGIQYNGDFSTPDYANVYYNGFPQLGGVGSFLQKLMPNPATTGAYDAWMVQQRGSHLPESVGKTPDFNYTPIQPARTQEIASFDWGNQADQAVQQAEASAPDSVQDWHSLGTEKRAGGTVVNKALMLLSHQANRQRGRP